MSTYGVNINFKVVGQNKVDRAITSAKKLEASISRIRSIDLSKAVGGASGDRIANALGQLRRYAQQVNKLGKTIPLGYCNVGIVEKIGFRSTAIRKFDKSLAIIPNFQFAENAVINISETTSWIISWVINLQYDTTVDQLKKVRDEIENYIKTHEDYKVEHG